MVCSHGFLAVASSTVGVIGTTRNLKIDWTCGGFSMQQRLLAHCQTAIAKTFPPGAAYLKCTCLPVTSRRTCGLESQLNLFELDFVQAAGARGGERRRPREVLCAGERPPDAAERVPAVEEQRVPQRLVRPPLPARQGAEEGEGGEAPGAARAASFLILQLFTTPNAQRLSVGILPY